jgi:histidine racemase
MLNNLRQNLQRAFTGENRIGAFQFSILKPGGNDTGLITGIIRNPNQRKNIAAALQEVYPTIEQVGFVNLKPKRAELMMAGGEFCGNATSCAAYWILKGKPGKISIKVSGVKRKLLAGVTQDGQGFSQMPIYADPSYIKPDPQYPGNATVFMEGITHYIDFDIQQIKGLTVDEIKIKARREMAARHLDQNSACGIIYVEQIKNGWAIHPIIYVRDADTLFYETACGSGTTALGLILALMSKQPITKIPVLQPSGLFTKVSVEFDGEKFGYTQIQSSIEKLHEGILNVALARFGIQPLYPLSTSRRILRSLIRN